MDEDFEVAPDGARDGDWVSAHLPDRSETVVVGELMPYDDTQGERVRDANGAVWCVVAESVIPRAALIRHPQTNDKEKS
jgi:hypothetical protein